MSSSTRLLRQPPPSPGVQQGKSPGRLSPGPRTHSVVLCAHHQQLAHPSSMSVRRGVRGCLSTLGNSPCREPPSHWGFQSSQPTIAVKSNDDTAQGTWSLAPVRRRGHVPQDRYLCPGACPHPTRVGARCSRMGARCSQGIRSSRPFWKD